MGFMDELKKLAKPYAEDDEEDFDDFEEPVQAPETPEEDGNDILA